MRTLGEGHKCREVKTRELLMALKLLTPGSASGLEGREEEGMKE